MLIKWTLVDWRGTKSNNGLRKAGHSRESRLKTTKFTLRVQINRLSLSLFLDRLSESLIKIGEEKCAEISDLSFGVSRI